MDFLYPSNSLSKSLFINNNNNNNNNNELLTAQLNKSQTNSLQICDFNLCFSETSYYDVKILNFLSKLQNLRKSDQTKQLVRSVIV
jgi:hypothetical protein